MTLSAFYPNCLVTCLEGTLLSFGNLGAVCIHYLPVPDEQLWETKMAAGHCS
jgi:hypothetical protein